MNINIRIRTAIENILANSRRPIESRRLARALARRFGTSIYRIWGNISFMKKTGRLTFRVRVKNGPSYIV